ncbi:hypothetical protein [Pararhodobacter sp.]|uniref:hypothetical protein n=1 Tax=Pararhodobacter sp. TaxID=2127056 RepID=UPI002AFF7367|nr:hypothetical protein [Pararhodobacter sp.]
MLEARGRAEFTTTAIAEQAGMAIEQAVAVLIHALARDRPSTRLSRILEEEEERLPRTPELIEIEAAIRDTSAQFFRLLFAGRLPNPRIEILTLDAFKIARAMFDGPQADVDPTGPDALPVRIANVILGYFDRVLRDT